MKILNVTPITDSAQFPYKKGTLQFLQDANKDTIGDLIKSLIGTISYNPSVMYVLSGGVNSGTGLNYIISAGVCFYGGEVYQLDAVSFTATAGQVGCWNMVVTQYGVNADPVTLSDATVVNLHDIRKMTVIPATSGSTGFTDYSATSFQNLVIPPQLSLSGTGAVTVSGTFPNINVDVPTFTVPNLQLLWVGRVNAAATSVTKLGGTATVTGITRLGIGGYQCHHNIASIKYFIDGVGVTAGTYASVRTMIDQTTADFKYNVSDDSSLNDTDHELRIFGYV